jgi:hypothetical protein
MGIRLRNLDPSLKQWIMAQSSLGPCIGDLFYVCPVDSSTSQYRSALEKMGVTEFYTTLAAAYADTVTNRNDIILVAPGAYDEAATLDWTKDNTHLIGLGGPNTRADYSEKNTVIYTDTAAVDYTIHLTGDHCQFINIGINNAGENAGNFSPLYVDGYGNYFLNVTLIGNMTEQQLADNDCASLTIGTNAHNCVWERCVIGEDCWGARSAAYSGQVSFIGSQPNGGVFKDCLFKSQSATAAVAMVTVLKGAAGSTHIGRGWIWDNCVFFNHNNTDQSDLNEVFYSDDGAGFWAQNLHNCSAFGFAEWSTNDTTIVRGTMPEAVDGGGLEKQLTDTVA